MKRVFLFCCFFLFLAGIKAQDRRVEALSHHKQYKVAAELIEHAGYYQAIDYLLVVVKKDSTNRDYKYLLAEAYFLARDYKNGEKWFEQVVKMDGKNTTEALFRYAECLKYNAKYELAKKNFETFSKSKYKEKKGEKFKAIARNEIGSCDFAMKNEVDMVSAQIEHLGDNINSGYTEFSPRATDDSTLVFASLQSDSVLSAEFGEIHYFHVKLYSSQSNGEEWGNPSELKQFNSDFANTANGVYSPDKTKFYFTRCIAVKHKVVCEIYVSELKDGEFQKPEKLKELNKRGHTTTMPTFFSYTKGKNKFEGLVFVSDRSGGRGGLDLWYSMKDQKTGKFKKPANMGGQVNSIRDEISPFYDNRNNILYFSSNYHFGFGGYDIFSSKGDVGKSAKPSNLGTPVNSSVDDTYFNLIENKTEGFMVSNRPGGTHLKSETCCDDIYSVDFRKPHLLALEVLDSKTKKDLTNAQVVLLSDASEKLDTIPEIEKAIEMTIPGFKDQNHYYNLKKNTTYTIKAFNKYDTAIFAFSTSDMGDINVLRHDTTDAEYSSHNTYIEADALLTDLYLEIPDTTIVVAKVEEKKIEPKEEIVLVDTKVEEKVIIKEPADFHVIINYDFDDTKFIEKHHGSLDTLVDFMHKYPDVIIEIGSHTDSKGSDSYNLVLSQRRSRVIEMYLLGKGINKKRLRSVGYGETKPVVPNENSDGSDNPEGRHLNRRTEIKVVDHDESIEKHKMLKHH